MTNIIYVCLIFVVCNASAWASPYPKECNKGPTYWCANFRNAKDCDAVGHCLQTVWTKQTVPKDNDKVALKFIKLFEQLRLRKDSFNEQQLQSTLDSACHGTVKPVALKCKEYLSDMAFEVRQLLDSDLSTDNICTVMGLCNNPKLDSFLASEEQKKVEPGTPKEHRLKPLLGAEKCTWGPSYWCANFSNSRGCKATHHCIERVWSKEKVVQDNDSVCQICTDMVKQARDQLQSNETQEELKEVFEGSCKLIPIKIVAKECMKLADDFVPELVETLASEMNPQTVCTVAGLCNNARIDRLLAEYEAKKHANLEKAQDCSGCHQAVGLMRKKFDDTSYEQFLMNLLQGCRKLGSFSDSCSMHVFAHFEDIYSTMKTGFTNENVCHLSGQCAGAFHQHAEDDGFVEISNVGNSGFLLANNNDNLPCELCEQLVKHLRDIVVANTTELEFLTVLKGVCKQTGNFRDECLSLVEQWYPVIYNYLISDLKPEEVCALAGICPKSNADEPIAPLISSELEVKVITPSSKLIGADEANSYQVGRVGVSSKQANVRVLGAESEPLPALQPLPLQRMFLQLPQDKNVCAFCQYFLHYLQVEISDTRNEEVIKEAVEHACERLPNSVTDECKGFIDAYGPSIIALLVQEIDPASVCPALGLCAAEVPLRRVGVNSDRSSCPLCLFAVEQLETVLKNNKTASNIRHALDTLCNHLSQKLKTECVDFVDTYSTQLVDMLLADLDAQEICVYLKLCSEQRADPLGLAASSAVTPASTPAPTPAPSAADKYHARPHLRGDRNNRRKPMLPAEMLEPISRKDIMIATNAIPDNTYNGKPFPIKNKSSCLICEFVMKELDDEIKDKHNADELKKIVHGVCSVLPKSVSAECNQFVDKYADLIISLLAQELSPDEVCHELKLCDTARQTHIIKEGILDCAVCETVIMAVEKVLGNAAVDHKVVHVMEKACNMLPAKYYDRCTSLMEIYGDSVIHLIEQFGTKGVCQKIGLCSAAPGAYLQLRRHQRH